jgi:hypothetical protein
MSNAQTDNNHVRETPDTELSREEKHDVMVRLRQEGDWEEADAFRERERRRLRQAGASRAEARDQAWKLMLKEYPGHEEEASWLITAAVYPPADMPSLEHADAEFADLSFAYFAVLAASVYARGTAPNVEHANFVCQIATRHAPNDEALAWARTGLVHPQHFLAVVERTFRAMLDACQQLNPASESDNDTIRELLAVIEDMPRRREQVLSAVENGLGSDRGLFKRTVPAVTNGAAQLPRPGA